MRPISPRVRDRPTQKDLLAGEHLAGRKSAERWLEVHGPGPAERHLEFLRAGNDATELDRAYLDGFMEGLEGKKDDDELPEPGMA